MIDYCISSLCTNFEMSRGLKTVIWRFRTFGRNNLFQVSVRRQITQNHYIF